ncbi:uncharacterized protein LOC122082114 [Macadamia integrifolia]|uniref:uncharacterized protein LOC122082114 n=1 Tax=Macadamia integrifolia TaxID=60698 RepID=UPI001C4FA0C3|nr:uncharacterized protein LOC122082114 [Macadamia integrifolia]
MVQTIPTLATSVLLPNFRLRKTGVMHHCKRHTMVTVSATRKDDYGGGSRTGKIGDENMVVLRKRIQEMKMVMERNEDDEAPPEHWMEWEKRYYTYYHSDVFEAVGLLQTQLMKTRPSVALGMVALLMVSVPTSTFMVALHLMKMANWIVSAGIHLS